MRHLTRRSAVTTTAVAAVLTVAATVVAPAASAGSSAAASSTGFSSGPPTCRIDYTPINFTGGFNAVLKVTNTGPNPVNGWWVEFDLSPGALIQTTSGGKFASYSGHIQVNAPDWLPNLTPGRYANVGFNGRNTGTTGVTVSNVTLNDVACTTS